MEPDCEEPYTVFVWPEQAIELIEHAAIRMRNTSGLNESGLHGISVRGLDHLFRRAIGMVEMIQVNVDRADAFDWEQWPGAEDAR